MAVIPNNNWGKSTPEERFSSSMIDDIEQECHEEGEEGTEGEEVDDLLIQNLTILRRSLDIAIKNRLTEIIDESIREVAAVSFSQSAVLFELGFFAPLSRVIIQGSQIQASLSAQANSMLIIWSMVAFPAFGLRTVRCAALCYFPDLLEKILTVFIGKDQSSLTKDLFTEQTAQHNAAFVLWTISCIPALHHRLHDLKTSQVIEQVVAENQSSENVNFISKLALANLIGSSEDVFALRALGDFDVTAQVVRAFRASFCGEVIFGADWAGCSDRLAFGVQCLAAGSLTRQLLMDKHIISLLFDALSLESQALNSLWEPITCENNKTRSGIGVVDIKSVG